LACDTRFPLQWPPQQHVYAHPFWQNPSP
jgi:hypothetical protein